MQPELMLFAPDYASARQRFCDLARQAGAQMERHTHPSLLGPAGESLSVDVARLGAEHPQRLLLISSGVHGIEGFVGSAVQSAVLAQGMFQTLPQDTAVVLVHAVNPFGFANLRRCDGEGIDLNRNFINWSQPRPEEHEHTGWVMERVFTPAPRNDEIAAFIADKGEAVYQRAITKGQYRFPLGVCYGGTGPAWSNHVWQNVLNVYVAKVEQVVHIDLHSGYGPVGGAVIMPSDNISAANIARARSWWGDRVEYAAPGPGQALANVSGPIEGSFPLYIPAVNAMSVTVETGTIPFPQVVANLIADHQRIAANQPATAASIALMRDAYACTDAGWQQSVIESFTAVVRDGLKGMAAERPVPTVTRLASQHPGL